MESLDGRPRLVRQAGLTLVLALGVACWPAFAWAVCSGAPAGFVPTPSGQLLTKYPEGGGALVSEVRNLVATTSNGLADVVGLVKNATSDQKRAIGAGLGQAAAVCARPDPDMARSIQEAILKLDSPDVSVAYGAATGDRETGSVGGAGGAGGGLGGGGTAADPALGGGGSNFFASSTTTVPNLITPYGAGVASVSLVETLSTTTSPSSSASSSR